MLMASEAISYGCFAVVIARNNAFWDDVRYFFIVILLAQSGYDR